MHWMTIDVLPTVAALIDAPLPDHPIDGRDATAVLLDKKDASPPRPTSAFYYHTGHLEAVRKGQWKLHLPHTYRTMQGQPQGGGGKPGRYRWDAKIEEALFDLESDPYERHDVAIAHPDVVRELREVAEDWRARLGDTLTGRTGSEVRPAGQIDPPAN